MIVNILGSTDDAKCYGMVRDLHWPDAVRCPHCDSGVVVKQGRDDTETERQRSECRSCERRFDDLTDTIFAGHHQPLRVWVLVLRYMGLNLSNEQIAKGLDLDPDDVRKMATSLRDGSFRLKPEVKLNGDVECDEVYVVAGHKGHPEAVGKKGDSDDDGDWFFEVHVNTTEGFLSLLRSWLRPLRGISQEKLPSYLGFFEFVHNIRRRGKALLGALVGLLVKPSPETNTG